MRDNENWLAKEGLRALSLFQSSSRLTRTTSSIVLRRSKVSLAHATVVPLGLFRALHNLAFSWFGSMALTDSLRFDNPNAPFHFTITAFVFQSRRLRCSGYHSRDILHDGCGVFWVVVGVVIESEIVELRRGWCVAGWGGFFFHARQIHGRGKPYKLEESK